MAPSRGIQGERVSSGKVYRRIKPDLDHYDFDTNAPDVPAFVPRPKRDSGRLSADLSLERIVASLAENPGYGICELDIEQMTTETAGRVWVERVPGGSPTHVGIYGCDDLSISAIIASLATMVPGYYPKRS